MKMATDNRQYWKFSDIEATPDVLLQVWQCFDLSPPGEPTTRRFVGRIGTSVSIYTSNPIIQFDPAQGIGEATDGAVIRLVGPPSSESLDAPGYIKDVSRDVVSLMKERKV